MRIVTELLIALGVPVFSPIVYSLPLQRAIGEQWAAWEVLDRACVEASSALWVADLDGWRDSVGTAREVMHYHRTREALTAVPARVLDTIAFMADAGRGITHFDVRAYTRALSAAELERMEGLIVREGLVA